MPEFNSGVKVGGTDMSPWESDSNNGLGIWVTVRPEIIRGRVRS